MDTQKNSKTFKSNVPFFLDKIKDSAFEISCNSSGKNTSLYYQNIKDRMRKQINTGEDERKKIIDSLPASNQSLVEQ